MSKKDTLYKFLKAVEEHTLPGSDDMFKMTALIGELGELANVMKNIPRTKIFRFIESPSLYSFAEDIRQNILHEIGQVPLCSRRRVVYEIMYLIRGLIDYYCSQEDRDYHYRVMLEKLKQTKLFIRILDRSVGYFNLMVQLKADNEIIHIRMYEQDY